MITAIIEINPDRTRKLIKEIRNPKREDFIGLTQRQVIEKFKTPEEIEISLMQWNESIKLLKEKTQTDEGKSIEVNPSAIDPKKISEEGKELIIKAMDTNEDEDWLNVVRIHNKENWSEVRYCCATDKLLLRIRLNKIKNELGI